VYGKKPPLPKDPHFPRGKLFKKEGGVKAFYGTQKIPLFPPPGKYLGENFFGETRGFPIKKTFGGTLGGTTFWGERIWESSPPPRGLLGLYSPLRRNFFKTPGALNGPLGEKLHPQKNPLGVLDKSRAGFPNCAKPL